MLEPMSIVSAVAVLGDNNESGATVEIGNAGDEESCAATKEKKASGINLDLFFKWQPAYEAKSFMMKDSCTKAVWPTTSKVRPLTAITETEFKEAKREKIGHLVACSTDIDGHAPTGGGATSIHLYVPL
jgi:hypothetical protein